MAENSERKIAHVHVRCSWTRILLRPKERINTKSRIISNLLPTDDVNLMPVSELLQAPGARSHPLPAPVWLVTYLVDSGLTCAIIGAALIRQANRFHY